jgi:hypothetical protein
VNKATKRTAKQAAKRARQAHREDSTKKAA